MAIRIAILDETYDISQLYAVVEREGAPALLKVKMETVSNNAKNYANATAESISEGSGLTAQAVESGDPPLYVYTIDETTNYLTAQDFINFGLESNLKNAIFILDYKLNELAENIQFDIDDNAKIIGAITDGVASVIDYIDIEDTEEELTKLSGTGHATITIRDLLSEDSDIGFETVTVHFRDGDVGIITQSTSDFFSTSDEASRVCLLWSGVNLSIKNRLGHDLKAIINAVIFNDNAIS
jgi:hypothetical protein